MSDDASGRFSSGELAMANWWVRNHWKLRRAGFAALSILAILLWLYIGWTLLDTYAISYPRESRISTQIAQNQLQMAKLQQDVPENLNIGSTSVANATDRRMDMYTEVDNPNPMWWAELTYRFNLAGEDTPERTGFVLPGRSITLAELGYAPKSAGGRSADLTIDDIRWHHVDPSVVGNDVDGYLTSRMNFQISKPTFDSVPIGKKTVGQTTFTLTNASSFGYWSVDLYVRLYRGGSQSAITRLTVQQLKPGEVRPINITWTDPLPGITKTDVEFVVNPLDSSVYLPTTRF
jgi:hypothetical protein